MRWDEAIAARKTLPPGGPNPGKLEGDLPDREAQVSALHFAVSWDGIFGKRVPADGANFPKVG